MTGDDLKYPSTLTALVRLSLIHIFRIFREQILDAIKYVQGDALCGSRIMFGDMGAQGDEVMNGFRRP